MGIVVFLIGKEGLKAFSGYVLEKVYQYIIVW